MGEEEEEKPYQRQRSSSKPMNSKGNKIIKKSLKMDLQDGEEFSMKPSLKQSKVKSPYSGTSNSDAEKSYKVQDAEENSVKISIPISKKSQLPSREKQNKAPEEGTGNLIKKQAIPNEKPKLQIEDDNSIRNKLSHKSPTSNSRLSRSIVNKK